MSKSIDKRPTAQMKRAVVVTVLTQPGATKNGPVINLNDPRQTGDGHWLMQKHKKPKASQSLLLTDRFERAVEYAIHIHAGQRRQETPVPYLAHLLGVASIVLEDRGDEDEAIAALLHDAAEDQGGRGRLDDIATRFGHRVGTIVQGCTDTFEKVKPQWLSRKQEYMGTLRKERSESVLRVSGADKLHNLRSITADFYRDGAHVFCRFKGGEQGTLSSR